MSRGEPLYFQKRVSLPSSVTTYASSSIGYVVVYSERRDLSSIIRVLAMKTS
jgi:hypothetical protein